MVPAILGAIKLGEMSYRQFHADRLEHKTVKLYDKISTNKNEVFPKPDVLIEEVELQSSVSSRKDIGDALRYIDYARERGFDMRILLSYPITSVPYFLLSVPYYLYHIFYYLLLKRLKSRHYHVR